VANFLNETKLVDGQSVTLWTRGQYPPAPPGII